MQKKLLLIVNPVSGKKKGIANISEITAAFKKEYDVTVLYTKKRGDATRFAQEKGCEYDVIASLGGDGTLNEVVTGLIHMDAPPVVICLPGGTTNLMADALNIPLKDLELAAQGATISPPVPVDIGKIDGHYFVSVVSFGAFTDASYNTPQKLKNHLGYGAYILGAIRSFFRIRKQHIIVEFPDETLEDDFILGCISNCNAPGGVIKLPPERVQVQDGLFEVVLIRKPRTPLALWRTIWAVFRKKFDDRYVILRQTDHMLLRVDRPIPWTIDGEYRGDIAEVKIEVLPSALEFKY